MVALVVVLCEGSAGQCFDASGTGDCSGIGGGSDDGTVHALL